MINCEVTTSLTSVSSMKIFHYLQPLNEINYMERLSRFHGELLERKVITIMAGNKLAVRFACFPTEMLYYRKVSV